jgi:phosphoglycolate phosphatase-like HAD superfamily hydrolase
VALGTGNFRFSAGIKLGYYGLLDYFSCGGFGDQTEDRASLIASGIRAASRRHGIRHETVFVIGDTVHDMTAAKANGAVAVGVTTGNVSAGVLSAAGADIVLASLEKAEEILPRR